ncbi:hypothetical protein [Ramlibacter albus]|uniref:Spore coat protein U domain-containing protein n=1 Tax=Ramlibacter albus TaxID=2079448 RepID=A0A923S0J2_9BURK|nr:hypothetical protein [Ramlibacter albus]MBC5763266.1 hypothetical protein [Ramlibacter albus]
MKKLILSSMLAFAAMMTAQSQAATTANIAVPVQVTLTPLCVLTAPSTIAIAYTSFAASNNASQNGAVKCTNSRPYKLSWDSTTDTVTTTPSAITSSVGISYTLSITAGATGTGDGNDAAFTVRATTTGNEAGTCATGGSCVGTVQNTTLYVHY